MRILKMFNNKIIFFILVIMMVTLLKPVVVSAETMDKPDKYLKNVEVNVGKNGIGIGWKWNKEYLVLGDAAISTIWDGKDNDFEPGIGNKYYRRIATLYMQAQIYNCDGILLGTTEPDPQDYQGKNCIKCKTKINTVYFCKVRVLAKYKNSNDIVPITTWSDNIYNTYFKERFLKVTVKSPSLFFVKVPKIKGIKYYKIKIEQATKKMKGSNVRTVIKAKKVKPGKVMKVNKKPIWNKKNEATWFIEAEPVYIKQSQLAIKQKDMTYTWDRRKYIDMKKH